MVLISEILFYIGFLPKANLLRKKTKTLIVDEQAAACEDIIVHNWGEFIV